MHWRVPELPPVDSYAVLMPSLTQGLTPKTGMVVVVVDVAVVTCGCVTRLLMTVARRDAKRSLTPLWTRFLPFGPSPSSVSSLHFPSRNGSQC